MIINSRPLMRGGFVVSYSGLAALWLLLAGTVGCGQSEEPSGGPPPITSATAGAETALRPRRCSSRWLPRIAVQTRIKMRPP